MDWASVPAGTPHLPWTLGRGTAGRAGIKAWVKIRPANVEAVIPGGISSCPPRRSRDDNLPGGSRPLRKA
jgi:hypothetical protein